jgi:hypothetical protein
MEVHHHSHDPAAPHSPKNWKSYFWEFLMLFLAVFCGFLAEYQLEQTIERHREKEFIHSMVEDALADRTQIQATIMANEARIKYADSLAAICYAYTGTAEQRIQMGLYWRGAIHRPDLVYPIDRTLFQLKNAGGMRLIQNKSAADSIIAYDNAGKRLLNQQSYYEKYLDQVTEQGAQLLNFKGLMGRSPSSQNTLAIPELIQSDEVQLKVLANKLLMFKGVLSMYVIRLNEMERMGKSMVETLQLKYPAF